MVKEKIDLLNTSKYKNGYMSPMDYYIMKCRICMFQSSDFIFERTYLI